MSATEETPAAMVDLAEARQLIEAGEAVLVDVREPHEWDAGHVPGALHIPIGELDAGRLPGGKQVVTTCRSGGRGARAASALTEAGVPARNLSGGMRGWHEAGLPLQRAGGGQGTVE